MKKKRTEKESQDRSKHPVAGNGRVRHIQIKADAVPVLRILHKHNIKSNRHGYM